MHKDGKRHRVCRPSSHGDRGVHHVAKHVTRRRGFIRGSLLTCHRFTRGRRLTCHYRYPPDLSICFSLPSRPPIIRTAQKRCQLTLTEGTSLPFATPRCALPNCKNLTEHPLRKYWSDGPHSTAVPLHTRSRGSQTLTAPKHAERRTLAGRSP